MTIKLLARSLIILFCSFFSLATHAVTLKIATLSPDGSSWMNELRAAAKEIETRTDGRVRFKFYPGGVMGDDKAVLRKMRFGQLHGATFTNGSLHHIYPDVQVYNLVMKFRDHNEVDYVRKQLDPLIMQGLEDNGMVTFGLAEIGFAYLLSTKPIASLQDLRHRKIWVPEGNEIATETIKAFSVSPIPLSIRDVLVSLQTGMIDTVAGSGVGAIALQWHTQVSHLTDLPLSYVYGIVAVDKRTFKKIKPADQAVVREVLGKATIALNHANRRDNQGAMQALKQQGIKFVKPSQKAVAELKRYVESANKNLIGAGNLSPEMVARLDALLAQYRANGGKP